MITVFDFLHEYCELRNLPHPTTEDLERCGRMINHHFRHYWAIHHYDGLVDDCGFVIELQGDKKITVIAYPDIFQEEMIKRINIYFIQKSYKKSLPEKPIVKEVSAPEIPVKKRKRIPPKPTIERSVKPTKIQ